MNTTTIQKWGNSYAVRLPKTAIHKLNLQAGNEVEIHESLRSRTLSIIPVLSNAKSLSEMVSLITKKNSHSSIDWGGAMGKEVW